MSTHAKDVLIESLMVWALVFYLAMAVAVLLDVGSWWLGRQEIRLNASSVRWGAIIAIVPLAVRLVCRARVLCGRDMTWMIGWLKHHPLKHSCIERSEHIQKDRRQHPRCQVQYPARIATEHGTSGFAMIADVSLNGCRVKSKTIVVPGDFGRLLINVPTAITPVTVSLISVRWVNGQECGLEFILIDLTEQGCLDRCLNRPQIQVDPVVATVR